MFGYKSARMEAAYERVLKNEVAAKQFRLEGAGNPTPRAISPVVLVERQTTYPAMHYLGLTR